MTITADLPATQVRQAALEELPALARVLMRAFADDPVTAWLWPDESSRVERLARFFADVFMERLAPGRDEIFTDDDLLGVACWTPPGQGDIAPLEMLRLLGDMPKRTDLRNGLARALGDPALELAFWMPDLNRYVDAGGSPVALPDDDARRTATEIDHQGERVGAIVQDRAQDTETVRAAGAATALLLENQRLDAELRARLVELRASRARLVEAADGERRRLERNLHDGAQSQLVALALNPPPRPYERERRFPTPQRCSTARSTSLDRASRSCATLRGIHPAVLSERGLEPAVRALAARAPVPVEIVAQAAGRLPAAVETAAYFVVAEALTNVSKYAHAEHATVRVERVDGQLLVEVTDDGVRRRVLRTPGVVRPRRSAQRHPRALKP